MLQESLMLINSKEYFKAIRAKLNFERQKDADLNANCHNTMIKAGVYTSAKVNEV
jgi:hypothetical protein